MTGADDLVVHPGFAAWLYPYACQLVLEERTRMTPLRAGFWVVDGQQREILGFVSAAPHAHAVLGRHTEVDLQVSQIRTAVSLRQALLRAVHQEGELTLRLLDLESLSGIVLHDGRAVRAFESSGPIAVQLAGVLLFCLPDAAGYDLPDALPEPELHGVSERSAAKAACRGHGLVRPTSPSRASRCHDSASVIRELEGVLPPREGSFVASRSQGSGLSVDLPAAELAGASAFDVSIDGCRLGTLVLTPEQLRVGVLLGRYSRCWDLGDHSLPESVSRVHTLLIYEGDELHALDLGSTNGTLVDGERVRSVVVRPNLCVSLGEELTLSARFVG